MTDRLLKKRTFRGRWKSFTGSRWTDRRRTVGGGDKRGAASVSSQGADAERLDKGARRVVAHTLGYIMHGVRV